MSVFDHRFTFGREIGVRTYDDFDILVFEAHFNQSFSENSSIGVPMMKLIGRCGRFFLGGHIAVFGLLAWKPVANCTNEIP